MDGLACLGTPLTGVVRGCGGGRRACQTRCEGVLFLSSGAPFMWVRGQRTPVIGVRHVVRDDDEPAVSMTDLEPAVVHAVAAFAVGVRVPDCQWLSFADPDGSGEYTLWLLDAVSRSWASVDYEPDADRYRVEQAGARRL